MPPGWAVGRSPDIGRRAPTNAPSRRSRGAVLLWGVAAWVERRPFGVELLRPRAAPWSNIHVFATLGGPHGAYGSVAICCRKFGSTRRTRLLVISLALTRVACLHSIHGPFRQSLMSNHGQSLHDTSKPMRESGYWSACSLRGPFGRRAGLRRAAVADQHHGFACLELGQALTEPVDQLQSIHARLC